MIFNVNDRTQKNKNFFRNIFARIYRKPLLFPEKNQLSFILPQQRAGALHLRGFRRLYGAPVHTYLQQYRLQVAARLLRTTSDSVLHIAVAVGYTGTSQFDSAFKALYHMTPAQYRKWCRENNVQNR